MKETEKKREVRLLALDVDGTLFDSNGHVTEKTIQALKSAREKGVQVVLASGRGYDWMPWDQLTEVEMDYVITTNGGGVYRCGDGMCLHEETMDGKELLPLFQFLQEKEVYITVFMDGATYTPRQCFSYVENMDVPEYVAQSLKDGKKELKDLEEYIRTHEAKIQKVTLNFQKAPDGGYLNREKVKEYLEALTDIHAVDGGCQSGIYKSRSQQSDRNPFSVGNASDSNGTDNGCRGQRERYRDDLRSRDRHCDGKCAGASKTSSRWHH